MAGLRAKLSSKTTSGEVPLHLHTTATLTFVMGTSTSASIAWLASSINKCVHFGGLLSSVSISAAKHWQTMTLACCISCSDGTTKRSPVEVIGEDDNSAGCTEATLRDHQLIRSNFFCGRSGSNRQASTSQAASDGAHTKIFATFGLAR